MADSRTIRNLQTYIYKRPGDASLERVLEHITAVDSKAKLTAANRDALLIPACSHPDADVMRWLIDHGARPQKQLKKLMTMTVGWNERRLEQAQFSQFGSDPVVARVQYHPRKKTCTNPQRQLPGSQ